MFVYKLQPKACYLIVYRSNPGRVAVQNQFKTKELAEKKIPVASKVLRISPTELMVVVGEASTVVRSVTPGTASDLVLPKPKLVDKIARFIREQPKHLGYLVPTEKELNEKYEDDNEKT